MAKAKRKAKSDPKRQAPQRARPAPKPVSPNYSGITELLRGRAYIRQVELCRALGISAMTLWRWQRSETVRFPRSVPLGPNFLAVECHAIKSWLDERSRAAQ